MTGLLETLTGKMSASTDAVVVTGTGADTTGSEADFYFKGTENMDFSVGVKYSGDYWTDDGTFLLNDDSGTTGEYPTYANGRTYAVDHMFYQKYTNNSADGCVGQTAKTHAVSSQGDAYAGTNTPDKAPWATCQDDPNGFAEIGAGGHWESEDGDAKTYGDVAEVFGFTFAGHTGYTKKIYIEWWAGPSANTFLCGDKAPVKDSHVIYNKKQ